MDKNNQLLNLSQINEITSEDPGFKKELIGIFLSQIPEFLKNMKLFFSEQNLEGLARESHTAKSSVLIFGMENTGMLLKQIQNLAEKENANEIPSLLKQVETDLIEAFSQLDETIKNL